MSHVYQHGGPYVDDVKDPQKPCFDCKSNAWPGGTSVPVLEAPGGSRWFCRNCANWRSANLCLFDVRTRRQLEREVA